MITDLWLILTLPAPYLRQPGMELVPIHLSPFIPISHIHHHCGQHQALSYLSKSMSVWPPSATSTLISSWIVDTGKCRSVLGLIESITLTFRNIYNAINLWIISSPTQLAYLCNWYINLPALKKIKYWSTGKDWCEKRRFVLLAVQIIAKARCCLLSFAWLQKVLLGA